ncbi:MAG: protein arginine kinase [Elusimicrobia bacterium]|nr:protein arginine kinase [Elusimicrobiota bacterium]
MTGGIPFHDNPRNWFHASGPESSVVISSRVRLARNLQNVPFPGQAKPGELTQSLESVFSALQQVPAYKEGQFFRLSAHTRLTREILIERHLISQNQCENAHDCGLAMDADGNFPLMVNEEDHIRMASVKSGLLLEEAWREVDGLDTALGQKLTWAYHPSWGFLTACPTNCGTGLRVSARLHLPALSLAGGLQRVLQGLNRLGLVVRGYYGEGTRALGEIFQVSNATTLGRSEKEIIDHVQKIIRRIIQHEMDARQQLMSGTNAVRTEDQVHRAMALLQAARCMNYEETMTLLSRVRLGLYLDMKLPASLPLLNEIMLLAQPAHVQQAAGKDLSPAERDVFRATLIRKTLRSHPKK